MKEELSFGEKFKDFCDILNKASLIYTTIFQCVEFASMEMFRSRKHKYKRLVNITLRV